MVIRIILLFVGFALLICGILLGSSIASFLDPASLVITVGGGLTFAMAAQGPGRMVRAISVGITQAPVAPEEARRHAACLSSLRGTFIGAGLTGSLIGLVSMLQTLDDPTTIGPAAAIMILTVFYGVMLGELIVNPMRHAVLRIAHDGV